MKVLVEALIYINQLEKAAKLQRIAQDYLVLVCHQESIPMPSSSWPVEIYESESGIQGQLINQRFERWKMCFLESLHVDHESALPDSANTNFKENEDNDELGYGLGLF